MLKPLAMIALLTTLVTPEVGGTEAGQAVAATLTTDAVAAPAAAPAPQHTAMTAAAPPAMTPAPPATWAPTPFTARYVVRYEGIPFSAVGERSLTVDAGGELHFRSDISSFLLQVEEQAHMRVDAEGSLQPLDYSYRQRGIGRNRTRLLDFDWQASEVHRGGDRTKVTALNGPVFDPVSWQLALRRDMASGNHGDDSVLEYPITDGGDPKTYVIAVRGHEMLDLPSGPTATVRVERVFEPGEERLTSIWLAPELDWLLVRLELIGGDGRRLVLELDSITS